MNAVPLLGALVVTAAVATGSLVSSGSRASGGEPTEPDIVAVELIDTTGEVWLATTAGLVKAPVSELQDPDTFTVSDAVWTAEPVAGRADRPIDDFDSLEWPRGETLMAASEGDVWARGDDGTWQVLECDGDECPTGIIGLSSTFDDAAPLEHDLIAFGADGIWVLARDRSITADQATPPTGDGWVWIELESGVDIVAASQDQLGRIWAVRRTSTDQAEIRVYDDVLIAADGRSRPTMVSRPLPTGWGATNGDSLITPDTRGGMWLGLPRGLLWVNSDLAVRDELDQCELGVVGVTGTECQADVARVSVTTVDNNRDDVWVGTSRGIVRLSVGATGTLGISSPHQSDAVVSMARNLAGGDLWVATTGALHRIEVDRWSFEPSLPDAVTAISAGGQVGSEVVLVGTTRGLQVARWNSDRAELAVTGTPDGLSGLITGISRVLDDGTAFVVGEIGVTRLENGAEPTGLADMADQRVAAVEVVDDQVYVATATGVFSAPVDGATAAGAFSPVDLPESTSDVTAIWSAGGRVWVGTGGGGLVATGDPVRTCGVAPPPDAVVRSAVTTGDDSFVVVTNDGVYDARPPDAAEACDVRFEHRSSADTNVAIPAGDYTETVAAQVPDRSRLIWAGADHGIDLIAWPGALRGVPIPVISAFDRLSFLDGSRVSALATVGGGLERTLVIGTDYGVYYHRPAVVPPRFAVESVASYDETGATTGPIVDCATVDCLDPLRFEHETRQLVMSMTVDDLGDADRFQFVVDEGGAAPTVSGRQLTLTTGRGRTESLTITALDLHLNASDPHELDLVVRQRTLREWFVETNAKWVAGLVAVALVAGISGFWTVRWLRRRGRRRLIDAEVTVRPDGTGDLVVTTRIGDGEEDWSVRRIDAAELGSAWAQVRSTKDAVLVPELGDVLYDALLSHGATRLLKGAGFGTRDGRLRIRGLDPALDSLPWEAMRTPLGALIGRSATSVVRDLRPADDTDGERTPAVDHVEFPVRVLVVVATPNDLPPIEGAADEVVAIESAAAARVPRPRPRRRGGARARDAGFVAEPPRRCPRLRLRARHRPRRAHRPWVADLARGRGRRRRAPGARRVRRSHGRPDPRRPSTAADRAEHVLQRGRWRRRDGRTRRRGRHDAGQDTANGRGRRRGREPGGGPRARREHTGRDRHGDADPDAGSGRVQRGVLSHAVPARPGRPRDADRSPRSAGERRRLGRATPLRRFTGA